MGAILVLNQDQVAIYQMTSDKSQFVIRVMTRKFLTLETLHFNVAEKRGMPSSGYL